MLRLVFVDMGGFEAEVQLNYGEESKYGPISNLIQRLGQECLTAVNQTVLV